MLFPMRLTTPWRIRSTTSIVHWTLDSTPESQLLPLRLAKSLTGDRLIWISWLLELKISSISRASLQSYNIWVEVHSIDFDSTFLGNKPPVRMSRLRTSVPGSVDGRARHNRCWHPRAYIFHCIESSTKFFSAVCMNCCILCSPSSIGSLSCASTPQHSCSANSYSCSHSPILKSPSLSAINSSRNEEKANT